MYTDIRQFSSIPLQVAIKLSHCTNVLTSNEPTTSLIPALGAQRTQVFSRQIVNYDGNDRRCIYLCPTYTLANKRENSIVFYL